MVVYTLDMFCSFSGIFNGPVICFLTVLLDDLIIITTPKKGGGGGHSGRVATLSPPTSEAGVRSPHELKWESW